MAFSSDDNKVVSPSRTYNVMCYKSKYDGYYFKKVVLPEHMENNAAQAVHYFLQLDLIACAVGAIPVEDYANVTAVVPMTWLDPEKI